jgi:predicted chitinase
VHEFGNAEYFTKHYEGRADLGNAVVGDGIKYAGRGFIQITGRRNYRNYGRAVGQDLEGNPDLALQPLVSAKILARYFKDHGVSTAADNADWVRVRKLVNGGTNGLAKFLQTEQELQDAEESQPPVPVDDKIAHHLSIIEKLLQLIHGKRS